MFFFKSRQRDLQKLYGFVCVLKHQMDHFGFQTNYEIVLAFVAEGKKKKKKLIIERGVDKGGKTKENKFKFVLY